MDKIDMNKYKYIERHLGDVKQSVLEVFENLFDNLTSREIEDMWCNIIKQDYKVHHTRRVQGCVKSYWKRDMKIWID